MAACIKSVFLMGFIMSVMVFAFRLFYFSRLQIFGTFLLLIFFEAVLYALYFISTNVRNVDGDIESMEKMHGFFGQKKLAIRNREINGISSSPTFMKIVMDKCLRSYPTLFEFVKNTVDISQIDESKVSIMSSYDIFNVKVLNNHSLSLFINFHKLNDIRWINKYFLEVHKKLVNGAYFLGRVDTIEVQRRKFFTKYPKYYAEFFY